MKSIQDAILKPFPANLLITLLSIFAPGLVSLNLQASPQVVLWDTAAPISGPPTVEARAGWKLVPNDLLTLEANPPKASSDPGYYGREYAFRGDAVVENQKLIAVFLSAAGRVVLYSKSGSSLSVDSTGGNAPAISKVAELVPLQSKTETAAIDHIDVLRNAADEVVLQVVFKGSPETSVVLGFGRAEIIDIKPSAAMNGVSIVGAIEYGIVPGFVGDDLIFGPQESRLGKSVCLPAENLLLTLLKGEASELMMSWPTGKQTLRLRLGDEQNGHRPIESIDFESGGQSFYLAPLAVAGVWHREALTPSYLEKDVPIGWKKPFAARWKTQLYEESLKTTFAFKAAKGDIWRGVAGSYDYPVWFDGDQAFYHLSKKVPPKGESIIYFLEGQGTPAASITPVDFLRATLGRPMADPMLDVAGRKLRTHHRRGGEGVHRACTCGCTEAIQAVFEAGDEVARKDEIKGDLEDMVYFVHQHVDRINQYRRFADELLKFLKLNRAASPELGPYLDGLEQTVQQIAQEYGVQQENMKSFGYADELVRRTLALTGKKDPDNLKAYLELLKEWRAMGGAQDYVLAQCHTITRKLAQEAGYGCLSDPKAVVVAQEVRARSRQCLRNPDGYEIWADY